MILLNKRNEILKINCIFLTRKYRTKSALSDYFEYKNSSPAASRANNANVHVLLSVALYGPTWTSRIGAKHRNTQPYKMMVLQPSLLPIKVYGVDRPK